MKCINCGNENKENINFCSNCGTKLEQLVKQDTTQKVLVNGNVNLETKNESNKVPTLSWISLGFLGMQILCFICQFSGYIYSKLLFIFEFPYIIVSLILAIISRVKNKDKMSLILIIVDIVLIIIAIIFMILAVVLFASLVSACLSPDSPIYNSASVEEFLEGCSSIG